MSSFFGMNSQGNRRSAGFTNEERQSFSTNFLSRGFVDTFRKQHPDVVGYTYWGYRHGGRKTNKGMRIHSLIRTSTSFCQFNYFATDHHICVNFVPQHSFIQEDFYRYI